MLKSPSTFTIFTISVIFFLSSVSFNLTEAYGHANSNGNITIKWDVMLWTPDGYVAVVTISNFQKDHQVQAPGWQLGWTWAKKEVIWAMVGAKPTRKGDCSHYKRNKPQSCSRNPIIIDLKPNVPYTKQIANCCRGGVLTSWFHYRPRSISAFQISVGSAGTSNRTVKLPKSVTFKAPRDIYSCGPAKVVAPTKFITADRRRTTQAMMTWNVTCLYSGVKKPT